jgi:hypothetical protein
MAAHGEQFEAAAFVPPKVPDDENFTMTPALAPLFGFVPGSQRWSDTNAPRLFQSLASRFDAATGAARPKSATRVNSWVKARTDLGLWAAAFALGTNHSGRDRELLPVTNFSSRDAAARVLEALSDYNPILDELQAASHRPYARFNLRYEEDNPAGILLPHLAKIKQFCQVLQLRASAELASGRTDDAVKDIKFIFYLTDTSRAEPIVISQLVRMAELQLALQPLAEGMGQWSEPQLRVLQEGLQGFDFCADIKRSLQAERVLFGGGLIEYARRSPNKLRLMEEFEGAQADGGGSSGLLPVGALMTAAPGGWLYLEQLNYSRTFDQYLLPLIDLNKRRIRPEAVQQSETAIAKITERSPAARFLHHEFFSGLLAPSLSRVTQKAAFAQTAVEAAALACALERYRLVHGQFPNSLDQLTPQFIAKLPHDIINATPLTYRLTPNGHYLLYSVGWNERDDGGLPKHTKSGEIENKEGDWAWDSNF